MKPSGVPVQKRPDLAPSHADAKAYGAFYTDAQIADFLAWWGVRERGDTVLDPSFGGGVFLRAASKRLHALRGRPERQVHGVELDPVVHRSIAKKLGDEFGTLGQNLRQDDFFRVAFAAQERFSAVLGNPPFIRYQKFTGPDRAVALDRAAAAGVKLSELSSAWAPFLVVSISLVQHGGRLAMVVPAELHHAAYARPVLEYLLRSFKKVTLLTFEQPLFPELSESTLLVLAEDRGDFRAEFRHRDFRQPGELAQLIERDVAEIPATEPLDPEHLLSIEGRFAEYLIPRQARELYAELRASGKAVPLGRIADVGIGYVSGANRFFHVTPEAAALWDIPGEVLKPIIRRSRGLRGLHLTRRDWDAHLQTGEASYLLHLRPGQPLPGRVAAYIRTGEVEGVHLGYKCRNRTPWYCVPHVHRPDAFLSYMSTRSPRLVSNDAEVFAPNSLHVLRFHHSESSAARSLASGWQTSLARLSCELQGHALGGGLLKLEPTEAEQTLVPNFTLPAAANRALSIEIDDLLRAGQDQEAQRHADEAILRQHLNLSKADCALLYRALTTLQERRLSPALMAYLDAIGKAAGTPHQVPLN